jgi:hypothetical protein
MRFTLPRRSRLTRERGSLAVFLLLACTLTPRTAAAQQLPAGTLPATPSLPQPNAQGPALIQQSIAALTGGVQVRDVTLTGKSTIPGNSGPQTGSIVLVATANGRTQVTTDSGSGIWDYTSGTRVGNYSSPDGVIHRIPAQNLPAIHPAWFFPAFIMAAGSPSPDFATSDMGQEARNGAAVRHVAVWRQPGGAPLSLQALALQHASQHDLYLDPSSSLPSVLVFRVRAFNPNNPDAPLRGIPTDPVEVEEEIHYSDYRQVHGVPIAFHIQLYAQGTLISDIQISSATINTGVAIAAVN